MSEVKLYQRNPGIVPDAKDENIAEELATAFNKRSGPRCGDYIERPDGTLERLSAYWNDKGFQTSDSRWSTSFMMCFTYASYSGGHMPECFPVAKMEDTGATKEADFWFFHHDQSGAHRSVGMKMPVRVFRVKP